MSRKLLEAIYESKTILVGCALILIGIAVVTVNHLQKVLWTGENVAYVPELLTFMSANYAVIAGVRAGVNYVNIKKEEITATREYTAAVTSRPTPPVSSS